MRISLGQQSKVPGDAIRGVVLWTPTATRDGLPVPWNYRLRSFLSIAGVGRWRELPALTFLGLEPTMPVSSRVDFFAPTEIAAPYEIALRVELQAALASPEGFPSTDYITLAEAASAPLTVELPGATPPPDAPWQERLGLLTADALLVYQIVGAVAESNVRLTQGNQPVAQQWLQNFAVWSSGGHIASFLFSWASARAQHAMLWPPPSTPPPPTPLPLAEVQAIFASLPVPMPVEDPGAGIQLP